MSQGSHNNTTPLKRSTHKGKQRSKLVNPNRTARRTRTFWDEEDYE